MYLNVKNETMDVLERNIGEFLFSFSVGKGFVNVIQNPKAIKEKIVTFDNIVKRKCFSLWSMMSAVGLS